MRRNIRRNRDEHNMPPIPQRRDEIPNLPNDYQITHRQIVFLLHDSGVGKLSYKQSAIGIGAIVRGTEGTGAIDTGGN